MGFYVSPFASGGGYKQNKIGQNGSEQFSQFVQQEGQKNGWNRGPESGMAVPHVLSMQGIVGTSFRCFWHGRYDEAIRDSQENADAMRNDPFIRRLMDENKYDVCSLRQSVEVDDERDPRQKALKDGLTQIWQSIPRLYDLNWYMMEARWYGRYAAQFTWHWKEMDLPAMPVARGQVAATATSPGLPAILGMPSDKEKRRVLMIKNHIPYEGDKIGYDYDGCPYILIQVQAELEKRLQGQGAELRSIPDVKAKSMEYGYTTAGGKALFLRSQSWRERFAIHSDEILDGPFLDAEKGDQIHGIGMRSVIYWYWWLRDEFLSNVADWCARTGLGVRLWYYESGNPQSEAAIDQAARDQNDKVNIKVPVIPGSELQAPVQFVDTSGTGADLLLRIVQHIEEHIEIYAVGQSMSRGSQENNGSGFGDRGRTEFSQNTKLMMTRRNAIKLGYTYTSDILDTIKRWTYPELADIPARLSFDVETPDPSKYMESAEKFCNMGGKIREVEARKVLGFSSPRDGEPTLGGGVPGPPGMVGGGMLGGQKPPGGDPGSPPGPKPALNGKQEPTNGHSGGLRDWAKEKLQRFELQDRERAFANVRDIISQEEREKYELHNQKPAHCEPPLTVTPVAEEPPKKKSRTKAEQYALYRKRLGEILGGD